MGSKQRMRNEVPQIGVGFKFNFILNYIFPFLVSPFLVLVTPLALWRKEIFHTMQCAYRVVIVCLISLSPSRRARFIADQSHRRCRP